MNNAAPLLSRRSLVKNLGVAGALGGLMASSVASSFATTTPRRGEPLLGDKNAEPGIIDFTPPFDLNDFDQNWYMVMKITSNLIGAKSYVPIYTRGFILPRNKPAIPLFGHMGFWTWVLQKPDPEEFPDAKEGQLVQRALYTGRMLHPWTYEPADQLLNPITGKMANTELTVVSSRFLITPIAGVEYVDRKAVDSVDEYTRQRIENGGVPYIRFGDQLSVLLADIHQGEGDFQPRGDASYWSVNYDDLMNPDKPLINTDYSLAGIQRARVQKWLGLAEDDPTQIMWSLKGAKVHSIEDFPQQIREWAIREFPHRL